MLTVKIATQTVARMKPLEDLNSSNQGLLVGLCSLSRSCAMIVYRGRRSYLLLKQ